MIRIIKQNSFAFSIILIIHHFITVAVFKFIKKKKSN